VRGLITSLCAAVARTAGYHFAMKLLGRSVFVTFSAVFTVGLLALASGPEDHWWCHPCVPPPSFESEAASAIRLIDCTSISLNEGPYLPSAVRNQVIVNAAPGEAPHGEIVYATDGSFVSMRIASGMDGPWHQMGDSSALYPLRARHPGGVCDTATRVSFQCDSMSSRCELNASPL
jgi:hypothetical protein